METDINDSELTIRMTRAEALVLCEWIKRVDPARKLPVEPAEQDVLWSIEAVLESTLPELFRSDYKDLLAAARKAVLDSA